MRISEAILAKVKRRGRRFPRAGTHPPETPASAKLGGISSSQYEYGGVCYLFFCFRVNQSLPLFRIL